jgi:uncharacterized membrane protein YjdF
MAAASSTVHQQRPASITRKSCGRPDTLPRRSRHCDRIVFSERKAIFPIGLIIVGVLVTIWSYIDLHDHFVWWLEALPPVNWLRDTYDLSRNHYDRIGHFAQGFVPAMVARELLLRTSPLKRGRWLFALIVLSCLGVSAAYEFLEWAAAEVSGESTSAFLGTKSRYLGHTKGYGVGFDRRDDRSIGPEALA